MKKSIIIIIVLALQMNACFYDWSSDDSGSGQYFDYKLQGRWVSTGSYNFVYELIIDYNSITVFGNNWRYTDNPFQNVTQNEDLKGYSELIENKNSYTHTGNIYIYDRGEFQEGIPYLYWENEKYGTDRRKFLTFTYGSYNNPYYDTLVWIEEN